MRLPGLRGLSPLDVGRRVVREVGEDDCAGQAAQLAYAFLFSLFPLLLVLVTLVGYLPIPDLEGRIMTTLGRMLPERALSLVQETIRTMATERRGGLLSLGAVVALWSGSAGFRAIMSALNRAYDVEEGRPWWTVYGLSVLATLGVSVLMVTAFALLILGPQIGRAIAALVGLGDVFDAVWNVARWPAALVLLALALAVIYDVAPDVEQDWKWVTPGSALAVLAWVGASAAFSYYVQNFGSYDKTYGSLGAVIVLLLWLYLTGFMLLLGGEVNAVIEHLAPSGKRPGAKAQGDTGSEPTGAARREAGRGEQGERERRAADAERREDDRRRRALVWSEPAQAPGEGQPQGGGRPSPIGRAPGDRRRGERRSAERRRSAAGHLTLVRRPGAEPVRPGGVEAYDESPPAPHELLRELVRESRRVVALQARLLVVELGLIGRRLARGAGLAIAGSIVALVGLLYLAGAAVALLAGVMPLWVAVLVVSVVALLAGGAAVRIGLGQLRSRVLGVPQRAVAALRAEVDWLRGLLRR